MRVIYKMQMKAGEAGTTHTDEIIADNRISADLDYAASQFKNLKKGEIVLVHKGSTAYCLVEIVEKIEDASIIKGASFGIDYRIKNLGFFKDLPNDFYFKKNNEKLGPNGTFSTLTDKETKTYKFTLDWLNYLNQIATMNDTIKLLEYKKQIILQGPPGTGKTRLAKVIAEDLIKPRNVGNPESIVDEIIKEFNINDEDVKANRESKDILLTNFYSFFPKENLNQLSVQTYCVGRGDSDNFCWWLERGLKQLGYYSPGSARSYLIFWKKEVEDYSKHGFIKDIENNEEAMKKVAEVIYEVVNDKKIDNAVQYFGDGFLLKLLNTYYPEEYFPINSERMIENALKIFKVNYKGLNVFEKNMKLNQIFLAKKKQFNSQINNLEFATILFDKFNIKTGENIDQKEGIVAKGEYQIIQFHPSYSYEDFVRGIVAETIDNGGISYRVENKILSDFALKALDNPNGKYVLIIDEINRANLPSVLGELIYALEYRNEKVTSMYEFEGDREMKLPKNLFIIGTMNTADRSVGHIDYAIRRRFAFVDVLPTDTAIDNVVTETALNRKAKNLYQKVAELFNEDKLKPIFLQSDFKAKEVQLGHSYFLVENENQLQLKLEYEIKPLLNEYVKDGILSESASVEIDKL